MESDEQRKYRLARERYPVSYMSNAKWVRLFSACARSGVEVWQAEWRFIDSDDVQYNPLPREGEFLETRFADGRFQPFEYKWIRSIFIPREVRVRPEVGFTKPQNLDALCVAIANAGQFKVDERDDGITIVGHAEA